MPDSPSSPAIPWRRLSCMIRDGLTLRGWKVSGMGWGTLTVRAHGEWVNIVRNPRQQMTWVVWWKAVADVRAIMAGVPGDLKIFVNDQKGYVQIYKRPVVAARQA